MGSRYVTFYQKGILGVTNGDWGVVHRGKLVDTYFLKSYICLHQNPYFCLVEDF